MPPSQPQPEGGITVCGSTHGLRLEEKCPHDKNCACVMSKYTPAMRNLRISASRALRNINKYEPPEKVTFNGQPFPFPTRTTHYIWKAKEHLTEEERLAVNHITNRAHDNRKPCKWPDHDSLTMISLIERGDLYPEIYNPIPPQKTYRIGIKNVSTQVVSNERERDSLSPRSSLDGDAYAATRGQKRPRRASIELGYGVDEPVPPESSNLALHSNNSRVPTATTTWSQHPPRTVFSRALQWPRDSVKRRCFLKAPGTSSNVETQNPVATPSSDTAPVPQLEDAPNTTPLNTDGSNTLDALQLAPEAPISQASDDLAAPITVSPAENQSTITENPIQSPPTDDIIYTNAPRPDPEAVNLDAQHGSVERHHEVTSFSQAEKDIGRKIIDEAIQRYIEGELKGQRNETTSLEKTVCSLKSCIADRETRIRGLEMEADASKNRILDLEREGGASKLRSIELEAEVQGLKQEFAEKERGLQEKFATLNAQHELVKRDLDESRAKEERFRQGELEHKHLSRAHGALQEQFDKLESRNAKLQEMIMKRQKISQNFCTTEAAFTSTLGSLREIELQIEEFFSKSV
ncbi:hypothetical protein TWF694_005146 [Orbilia ellipsospora]|uniref:Uncharacterized protein n=1 Tax=Orbilia ellipsospora TaxID=2528407 RepID=A0AAV9WWA7_9PEZI